MVQFASVHQTRHRQDRLVVSGGRCELGIRAKFWRQLAYSDQGEDAGVLHAWHYLHRTVSIPSLAHKTNGNAHPSGNYQRCSRLRCALSRCMQLFNINRRASQWVRGIGTLWLRQQTLSGIGNESVPKSIINGTISLFFNSIGIYLLLPYILFEKYIYILVLEITSPGNRHCADCIGTLRSLQVDKTSLRRWTSATASCCRQRWVNQCDLATLPQLA